MYKSSVSRLGSVSKKIFLSTILSIFLGFSAVAIPVDITISPELRIPISTTVDNTPLYAPLGLGAGLNLKLGIDVAFWEPHLELGASFTGEANKNFFDGLFMIRAGLGSTFQIGKTPGFLAKLGFAGGVDYLGLLNDNSINYYKGITIYAKGFVELGIWFTNFVGLFVQGTYNANIGENDKTYAILMHTISVGIGLDFKIPDPPKAKTAVTTKPTQPKSASVAAKPVVQTPRVIIDPATRLSRLIRTSDTLLAPNSGGPRTTVTFFPDLKERNGIKAWRFVVKDINGTDVFLNTAAPGIPIPQQFIWNGRNSNNVPLANGTYVGSLIVEYEDGVKAEAFSNNITIGTDTTVDPGIPGLKVKVVASPQPFSPDGDGRNDELNMAISTSGEGVITAWRLSVIEQGIGEQTRRVFKSWTGSGIPPANIKWDGQSTNNMQVESATNYQYLMEIVDNNKKTITDKGLISVDVLVIRVGNNLKLKVPSIVFQANANTFDKLPAAIVANNNRVIARVATILNSYPSYRVDIVGFANNTAAIQKSAQAVVQNQEKTIIEPLTTARARFIMQQLIINGVSANRMRAIGMGSKNPIVSLADAANRWKNRRVEFNLIRN